MKFVNGEKLRKKISPVCDLLGVKISLFNIIHVNLI